jgi:hypothetical protein
VLNSTIDEFDSEGDAIDATQTKGRINMPGPADNFDLSSSHYTDQVVSSAWLGKLRAS